MRLIFVLALRRSARQAPAKHVQFTDNDHDSGESEKPDSEREIDEGKVFLVARKTPNSQIT